MKYLLLISLSLCLVASAQAESSPAEAQKVGQRILSWSFTRKGGNWIRVVRPETLGGQEFRVPVLKRDDLGNDLGGLLETFSRPLKDKAGHYNWSWSSDDLYRYIDGAPCKVEFGAPRQESGGVTLPLAVSQKSTLAGSRPDFRMSYDWFFAEEGGRTVLEDILYEEKGSVKKVSVIKLLRERRSDYEKSLH